MALLEPFEVPVDAGACQGVIDQDIMALAREVIGKVGADETRATRHQNRAATEDGRRGGRCVRHRHATKPRASSSFRASLTRSFASCLATHSASSAKPSAKSFCGL